MLTNLIKISPFISLLVCFCRSWKDLTQPCSRHVLMTLWHVVNWPIKRSLVNASVQWGCKCYWVCRSTSIRYTRFQWLIYYLKRSVKRSPEPVLNRVALDPFTNDKNKRRARWKGLFQLDCMLTVHITSYTVMVFVQQWLIFSYAWSHWKNGQQSPM